MIREIAKRYPHTEIMDTWTWFQSGINTDGAHNPVTTRKVQGRHPEPELLLDDQRLLHGAGAHAVPRPRQRRPPAPVGDQLQGNDEGKKLLVPGPSARTSPKELNKIFEEHGLLQYRTFGYGHSFGTLSHYYGREAGLELREDIDTILEPNMVISMEPMIMLPEGMPGAGGYREHDILVITPEGNRNLTGFPYGPGTTSSRPDRAAGEVC